MARWISSSIGGRCRSDPLTSSPLAAVEYLDTSTPDSVSVWYAISAVDGTGNESARTALVRPGLIVGPHDATDRFGYWVARFLAMRPLSAGLPQAHLCAVVEDRGAAEGDLLEVSFDETTGDFGYGEPEGGRALLELAPTPSWRALQFRR